ncbi:MAG: hypothetical protein H7305_00020 [Gemmatimonadaceae bacterium]|nr:hypothetical protein [Gemmatimonadaceae bacterium]
MIRGLLVHLALVLLVATAKAQAPVADADRAALQRIEALVRDFERRGLPADLLRAKIAEGAAKGASQTRIADAVTLLALRVDSVARVLAPSVSVPELHAGAEALSVGVSALSLRSLRRAAGRRPADPYFLFVVRLVRRGVTPEQALHAARALISRQVASNTLLAIADDLARDVAGGMSPAAALHDRMTRLVGGFGPGAVTTGDAPGVGGAQSAKGKP